MLTKTGVNNLLQRLWETGGLSADMEADIEKLRGELDEREGILRKYGEVYDGEDKEEYDYVERETDGTDYKSKYEEMKKRYVDRFLGREIQHDKNDYEEIVSDTKEDVEKDESPQSFEELLSKSNNDDERG